MFDELPRLSLDGRPKPTETESPDKRSYPDGKEDETNEAKRQTKRRKRLTDRSPRRQAQNRASQRAFRERKEKRLRQLEEGVKRLEEEVKRLKEENESLHANSNECNECKNRAGASGPASTAELFTPQPLPPPPAETMQTNSPRDSGQTIGSSDIPLFPDGLSCHAPYTWSVEVDGYLMSFLPTYNERDGSHIPSLASSPFPTVHDYHPYPESSIPIELLTPITYLSNADWSGSAFNNPTTEDHEMANTESCRSSVSNRNGEAKDQSQFLAPAELRGNEGPPAQTDSQLQTPVPEPVSNTCQPPQLAVAQMLYKEMCDAIESYIEGGHLKLAAKDIDPNDPDLRNKFIQLLAHFRRQVLQTQPDTTDQDGVRAWGTGAYSHASPSSNEKHKLCEACARCQMKKLKCEGGFPCNRCKNDGKDCKRVARKPGRQRGSEGRR